MLGIIGIIFCFWAILWLLGSESSAFFKDVDQHGLKPKIERLWFGPADGGAK
jgi:Trk-type K+ transport system membrane component